MDVIIRRDVNKDNSIYETLYVDGEPVMGSPGGLTGSDILLWHKHNTDNGIHYGIDLMINGVMIKLIT